MRSQAFRSSSVRLTMDLTGCRRSVFAGNLCKPVQFLDERGERFADLIEEKSLRIVHEIRRNDVYADPISLHFFFPFSEISSPAGISLREVAL